MDSATYDEFVRSIYATIVDPSGWGSVLEQLRGLLASTGSVSLSVREQDTSVSAVYATPTDPTCVDSYLSHYWEDEADFAAALSARAVTEPSILVRPTDVATIGSSILNEWYLPQKLQPLGALACSSFPTRKRIYLYATCGLSADGMGEEEQALLARVIPHVRQALTLSGQFQAQAATQQAHQQALDRCLHGVMLVDRHARVVSSNEAATRLLSRGQWIDSTGGRLRCRLAHETRQLREAILAAAIAPGTSTSPGMAIHCPGALQPLLVAAVPLRFSNLGLNEPSAEVLVLVTNPYADPVPPEELLEHAFGLTPAEARAAVAVARGEAPNELADRRHVSRRTVRNQLQRVYEKTNTGRQAKLVKLLSTLLPAVISPDPGDESKRLS